MRGERLMPSIGRVVWLASYPKSGNTWLRLLIGNYLSDRDGPIDINQIDLNSPYPIRRDFLEEETFIDPSLLKFDEVNRTRARVMEDFVQRSGAANYVKTHDQHQACTDGTPLFGRGYGWSAVYIVRDPRDVAVSLAFHNNTSIDEAIAKLNNPKQCIGGYRAGRRKHVQQLTGDWSAHVASWADQSDIEVHILRYEDLQVNPVGTFGAIISFMGLECRAEQVERAVRYADFRVLQRQERQSGFLERPPESTAPFFRSGRAGAWAEVLTTAQSAAITAAHQPMMKRFGYL
jgi:aryl sulfotransferase